MNALKERLMSPPALALPVSTVHLTLDTDACTTQVGCVLLQQHGTGTTKSNRLLVNVPNRRRTQYDTT